MNKKKVCAPAETIKVHKMLRPGAYSITLNMPGQNFFSVTRREDLCIMDYYRYVQCLKHTTTFELYPEISKKGRWHYHGIINIQDTYNFHLYTLPMLHRFGNVDIDTIKDMNVWRAYITKDEEIMKPPILKRNLPYILSNDISILDWDFKEEPPKLKKDKKEELKYSDALEKWINGYLD